MKPYKTLFTDQGGSWQEAIDRYIAFTHADMKEYFSIPASYHFSNNEAYVYHPGATYDKTVIDKFQEDHKHHVPSDLVSMLSMNGCFTIGKGILEIFCHQKGFLNLSQVLNMYNLNNVVRKVSLSMLGSINQYYSFFGVSFPQSDEVSFLYFDKAGHLGKMYVHANNIDLVIKKTLPAMFSGNVDRYTLDKLMAVQLDRVITNALIVKGFIEIN